LTRTIFTSGGTVQEKIPGVEKTTLPLRANADELHLKRTQAPAPESSEASYLSCRYWPAIMLFADRSSPLSLSIFFVPSGAPVVCPIFSVDAPLLVLAALSEITAPERTVYELGKRTPDAPETGVAK
jgi:hypothetical protein